MSAIDGAVPIACPSTTCVVNETERSRRRRRADCVIRAVQLHSHWCMLLLNFKMANMHKHMPHVVDTTRAPFPARPLSWLHTVADEV
mmetsp:Transcript_21911/g.55934  ORF Transcript_21911/g.55934 Transcript_21911/m.55934 type:complete len:87 (-) Transcript_21911:82-342(-)